MKAMLVKGTMTLMSKDTELFDDDYEESSEEERA